MSCGAGNSAKENLRTLRPMVESLVEQVESQQRQIKLLRHQTKILYDMIENMNMRGIG